MRVVALTCSNTEIVAALGCSEMLVGVDDHSDYPPGVVERLPRVGPDLDVDPARVAALKPDLVIASLTVPGHERVLEGLERAGLPLIVIQPVSMDDVYENVVTIARALGVESRGHKLAAEMRREILGARSGTLHRPKILVEWWPKPVIVPGRRSWVNQLMDAAGAQNPLSDRDVESTPIDDAAVITADPDAVVISWCGVRLEKYRPEVVYRRDAWQGLRALRDRRVYCVPEAYLGRPGPRLVDGHRALRRIVEELQSSLRSSI